MKKFIFSKLLCILIKKKRVWEIISYPFSMNWEVDQMKSFSAWINTGVYSKLQRIEKGFVARKCLVSYTGAPCSGPQFSNNCCFVVRFAGILRPLCGVVKKYSFKLVALYVSKQAFQSCKQRNQKCHWHHRHLYFLIK